MSSSCEDVLWQARITFGAFNGGFPSLAPITRQRKLKKINRDFMRQPFKFFAKLAILFGRLYKQSIKNLWHTRRQCESVVHALDQYDAEISFRGVPFKVQDYRVNMQQQRLKNETRRLLEQDPSCRSESDINLLLVALSNISTFAGLPKALQRRLCQIGRYESYERNRVVQLNGDPSRCLYFILSGTLQETSVDEQTGVQRIMVTLTKGMSFGVASISSSGRCPATIFSKTEVELFSVSGSVCYYRGEVYGRIP